MTQLLHPQCRFARASFLAAGEEHYRTVRGVARYSLLGVHSIANPTLPLGRFAAAAIGLEAFLCVGALGGGIALMAGPNGEIIPLPVRALAGSPFGDYFAPGTILFAILGLGPLGAALLAWRRHPAAPFLAFAVGGALLIWLVVEIAIVGYSNNPPLQPFYLGLGVVITLVSVGWLRQTHALSPRRRGDQAGA